MAPAMTSAAAGATGLTRAALWCTEGLAGVLYGLLGTPGVQRHARKRAMASATMVAPWPAAMRSRVRWKRRLEREIEHEERGVRRSGSRRLQGASKRARGRVEDG